MTKQAATKPVRMKKYETVIILSPDLGEAQVKDELKKLEQMLQSHGAIHVQADRWAKRELGYRMKKKALGTFVFFKFETPHANTVENITGVLRIADNVLKFQTHRISDKVRKFKGSIKKNQSDSMGGDDFIDGSDGEYLSV